MNIRSVAILAGILVIIAAVAFVIFFLPGITTPPGAGGVTSLPSAEVRSYQGTDLSAIANVPENAISGTQYINTSDYRLTVDGLVRNNTSSTYQEVLDNHPHYAKVVTLDCVEGWSATILWGGVRVSDLIKDAGPDPRANTVIFHATDGYTTSFPLSYVTDNNILLADTMNNLTLDPAHGYPFRLVAEDKWGYKWIKWVDEIELSDNPNYEGYWEQRGYSNNGDLNMSKYA
ncbi:oxidoreductase, molybdopterin binding [Methanoregula boonei 6A8]|jgi:DMSO/TMAO reductase YedYZ molybdopterin-dependent catalytic subunit|uniref:Oxidoreductase, molybdopterin binding n=1 Tax=Methanoregula boonei (strain DSM 21154 / JCM 14090 / 6A8) TaxID=456442 RepID=A7I5D6_METB6|nr:molybdopterin-dependent oxidoreductase [Methanoregula boonei]ABS54947.1 oxidoreductase, molybdopterin binding [Methanoregula boonei 6A8]